MVKLPPVDFVVAASIMHLVTKTTTLQREKYRELEQQGGRSAYFNPRKMMNESSFYWTLTLYAAGLIEYRYKPIGEYFYGLLLLSVH